MSFCRLFIGRPVATTLIALVIFLSGLIALPGMPVATMPDMTATAIMVVASQPGANPQQMASSVTTPLERRLAGIADVTSVESTSQSGTATILLEFSSSRNINGALRDVQAGLRAARSDLPLGTLNSDPLAFKLDGGGPIYLLNLTSKYRSTADLYDLAIIRIRPFLARIQGVGRVEVVGASTPSIRVELNPYPLYKWGIGLEDIRSALASANAFTPKGFMTAQNRRMILQTNDQAIQAKDYRNLVIAWRNGRNPVRLGDVAELRDDVQDVYQFSGFNGENAVTIMVMPQPHANTIKIADAINEELGPMQASLPANTQLHPGLDLSSVIRASLDDAQLTLIMSVLLVVLVIALFFHQLVSTFIPAVTVPVVLFGTLAVMALFHFTLDILSLMALTIAVGFVVDDAIVVLENIARYMEAGLPRHEAALRGASEITFTVLSISLSLVAVFIPLIFIPGTLGSIFYEFGMTIIATILISMFLSLSLTPMLCARFLTVKQEKPAPDPQYRISYWASKATNFLEKILTGLTKSYEKSLSWALRHRILVGLTLPGSFILLITGIVLMPKEALPTPDMAIIEGRIIGEPSLSFQAMRRRLEQVQHIVLQNREVISVTAFNRNATTGEVFLQLTDKHQRRNIADIARDLGRSVPRQPGAEAMFTPLASSRSGSSGNGDLGAYRYVLRSDNGSELYAIMPGLMARLRNTGKLLNLSSDTEQQALAMNVVIRRALEARYHVTPQLVQNALFDAYGQAVVSTIHMSLTTHRVVMVLAEKWRQNPHLLTQLWLSTSAGTAAGGIASNLIRVRGRGQESPEAALATESVTNALANHISGTSSSGAAVSSSLETMIPLENVASIEQTPQPLSITHRNGSYAASVSFDLTPGLDYDQAVGLINQTLTDMHAPPGIRGGFSGTAGENATMLRNFLLSFVAAIAIMYITLGILYEDLLHPVTILSTLPSAGIGGVLGLWITGQSFSLIAFIAIILLTGLVKKNAILVVDFALQSERDLNLSAREAVLHASLTRFRPILMTSLASALGAVPLIIGQGYGCELRRPLGIAILGGMVISQLLTLYTTPVIYLWMDRLVQSFHRLRQRLFPAPVTEAGQRIAPPPPTR